MAVARSHFIGVRLSDIEYRTLINLCRNGKYSKSELLRLNLHTPNGAYKTVKRTHKVPKHEWSEKDFKALDELKVLNIQLAKTGNLVNQIARRINASSDPSIMDSDRLKLDQLKDETDDVRAVIHKVASDK